jgi:hypothetical protein
MLLSNTQSKGGTAMKTTIKAADYFDYTPLDGYDWMERVTRPSLNGTLQVRPEVGDWPYMCVVAGKLNHGAQDKYVIREFCEHDIQTWVYYDRSEYQQHLSALKEK